MIRQLSEPGCRYSDIMKRIALILTLLLAALDTGAVWAQHRQGGGGPDGGGGGRKVEERRAQRVEERQQRREQRQPAPAAPDARQGNQQAAPQGGQPGAQRMSPDERRQLREQIRNHGRDNYDPAKR